MAEHPETMPIRKREATARAKTLAREVLDQARREFGGT
jgi:hypothetical protein